MKYAERKYQAWGEGAEERKRVSHGKALKGPRLQIGQARYLQRTVVQRYHSVGFFVGNKTARVRGIKGVGGETKA